MRDERMSVIRQSRVRLESKRLRVALPIDRELRRERARCGGGRAASSAESATTAAGTPDDAMHARRRSRTVLAPAAIRQTCSECRRLPLRHPVRLGRLRDRRRAVRVGAGALVNIATHAPRASRISIDTGPVAAAFR